MLNDNGNLDDASQMHAFYLLTGFGLEVSMKSQLRHLGLHDLPDLRALGHDLVLTAQRLSDLSDGDGLPPNLLYIARRLGPAHQQLVMRYTPDHADLILPHPLDVMEVLDQLVDGAAITPLLNRG